MSARATAGPGPVLTVRRRLSASVTVAVESALLQIRAQWHPTNTISGIVQPASFLLIAWFAGRSTGRVQLEDAALGAALIALWGATVWSAGAILRAERWQGTRRESLSEPPDPWSGRAAVAWATRLAAGARYDRSVEHLEQVAATVDRILGRAL